MRILIDVASDRLRAELVELLTRAGHSLEYGSATRTRSFDLALVGTPEQAEKLKRERPHDAVIVVTRLGDVPERIRALEVGADDAIDASFPPAQSMARIDAAGRRMAAMPRPSERVVLDDCTIDLTACVVERPDGARTPLTPREVELIRWFVRHIGQVVSRGELLQNVFRMAAGAETRAVDVAIAGLRQKIERDPADPQVIISVRGAGYRWG